MILELLIAGSVGLVFGHYFPSYMKKKGENVATKEDIAEITSKIESVRSEHQLALNVQRSQLQVAASIEQAFREAALEAIKDIDSLLVRISLYCWSEIAERSSNEHYVWSNVAEPEDEVNAGFHYFRVAIDRATIVHGLYLSPKARQSLRKLADGIGLLSSMEFALSHANPDPGIVESAGRGYQSGLDHVQVCRDELMREFGLMVDE